MCPVESTTLQHLSTGSLQKVLLQPAARSGGAVIYPDGKGTGLDKPFAVPLSPAVSEVLWPLWGISFVWVFLFSFVLTRCPALAWRAANSHCRQETVTVQPSFLENTGTLVLKHSSVDT